jgi:hypothetical protein
MKGSQSQASSLSVNYLNTALQLLMAASFVVALSTSLLAQSTITCPSGQWDFAQIMRMQTSWAQNGYYLSGTNQSGGNVYMYQVATDITYGSQNQWTGGKLNYIKNYALPPNGTGDKTEVSPAQTPPYEPPEYVPVTTTGDTPEYWAYPADVDLFDSNYIYLWITEIDWNNPYAFKKFNSDSNDYSFRFAPRCGVPGQVTLDNPAPNDPTDPTNNPSTAFEILPSNVYQSGGEYNGDIITTNETFTSADCTNGFLWDNLGYAFTQVNTAQTGFSMNDTINGQRSLNYIPIVYWYNCDSSYGSCGNHEEFDYGYYPSTGDYYGLVQWLHFTGTSGTPDETATFNTMSEYTGANDGHYSYSNVNFPAAACF